MAYGVVQYSIATYLEWNLFADILGVVHTLNNVLVEMEGIYKVTICVWDMDECCVVALAKIVAWLCDMSLCIRIRHYYYVLKTMKCF